MRLCLCRKISAAGKYTNGKEQSLEELIIPQKTIEVIQKYGFNFQKKFGQNFLVDSHVLDKILNAADVTKDDTVLEIGPGIGNMTQRIAQRAGRVVAVEIDRQLIPILEETLSELDNITLIQGDILKLDLKELSEKYAGGRPLKVVANLPYYITTPIIMKMFREGVALDNITVMVQKEVADRMKAAPGSKDYGSLSVAVQFYSEPYLVANVPPNCFIPRPNVGSAVIRLRRCDAPPVSVEDEAWMFRIITAAFSQRRKTLQNCLANTAELGISKDAVAAVLSDMGLPVNVRGEALTLAQFAQLSDMLKSYLSS